MQVTADGHYGLTVNQGNAGALDGGAGSVTVIDLKAKPPHVVNFLGVAPLPEGSPSTRRAKSLLRSR